MDLWGAAQPRDALQGHLVLFSSGLCSNAVEKPTCTKLAHKSICLVSKANFYTSAEKMTGASLASQKEKHS